MSDIVEQARCMVREQPVGTHYAGCHERHYGCMIARLADEVERLREVIRRIAGQDCTVSICRGNVMVALDSGLTDAEREALRAAIRNYKFNCDGYGGLDEKTLATLRGLLRRNGGDA